MLLTHPHFNPATFQKEVAAALLELKPLEEAGFKPMEKIEW